ncbi:MAG TPA: amidohydrolase family protein [Vicinamibacterales bacterium]|nr:amidohydrolase family protein [Vicinamibacterales bacterium]
MIRAYANRNRARARAAHVGHDGPTNAGQQPDQGPAKPDTTAGAVRLTTDATAISSGSVRLQPDRDPIERGTLRLHYVGKAIGYERYSIVPDGDGVALSSDFDFTDRGGHVQLTATLRARPDYTPVAFKATGKSYRFVNVDSDIHIAGGDAVVRADGAETRVQVSPPFFTVDGYAPFAAQMLMLRYWKSHGQPRLLHTVPGLPANDVVVDARGSDAMRIGGREVRLERYVIDGVVWGRETIWLDEQGALAAAITRAGGLSFEAVRDDLESALGGFIERGARDRIGDLEAITSQVPLLASGTCAFVGATIVDGSGRAPITDGVVVVREGKIADVGARTDVKVPGDAAAVDVSGKTVIPGLWDMHTHATQIEWAPVYLAAGVTTVRDMGNEFAFVAALRDSIDSRRSLGPRLLLAGLVDGGGPNAFGTEYAATPDEARRVVAKYHDAGFQQIKIYSLVTPPIVEALSAEAHRLGMTVTGHVPNGMTIEQGVSAGMDQIAHLPIRGEASSDEVTRTIQFLREHKTVVDPTQSWNELLGHAAGTPVAAFQPGIAKIPAPLNRVFSNAGTAGIDAATARTRLERTLRIVKALHDAGVPVVAGTDEGVPGHSVHREIELYVEAGFTPMEALQAATIVSARAMKLDAESGTIERGKRADLVVLDANPLDSIGNIRRVRWTVRDGRVYDASALWKSVRFTP